MGRGSRAARGIGLLLVSGVVFWFGLGMHRGLLLSEDIKSRCWPWSPLLAKAEIAAPALSDPVWQFVPWLDLARRELRAGRIPLWNPHQSGGAPLLGNGQSALGSPLVWPVLLAGVENGWNVSLLLRLLVAFGGALLWLRDCGRSTAGAAMGAIAFALSGPFVAWLEHPQSATAAALPLVILFIQRLARVPRARDFLGLSAATYLVLSGGHPETQLMGALLCAAVLAHEARASRNVAAPLSAAAIGAGLAAPVLLPFAEYFVLSEAGAGSDRHPFVLPLSDLARFVSPRIAGSNVIEAAATVSLVVLALAVLSLSRIGADRRARFWALVAFAVPLVAYDNPFSRVLARHSPVYWTRALLLLPLALGYLASGSLDALLRRMRARGWQRGAGAAGALAAILAAVELLAAARGVHGRTPADYRPLSTPLLSKLAEDRGIFRVLPLHTFLPPDSATDYGLDDVRGYDAMGPRGWRASLESMGRVSRAPTQLEVLEPWELVPGGAALDDWNVKYLLLHPQFAFGAGELNARKGLDLEEVYSGPDGRILRNRRARPRARLSGEGSVAVDAHTAGRWDLRVSAPRPSELTLANPMFPGWTARIDGRSAALAIRPGEAIRLAVPGGTHRVELDYRPGSFRLGCLAAFVSAAALWLGLRRLARAAPSPEPAARPAPP